MGILFQEKYHLRVNSFIPVQKLDALMLHFMLFQFLFPDIDNSVKNLQKISDEQNTILRFLYIIMSKMTEIYLSKT